MYCLRVIAIGIAAAGWNSIEEGQKELEILETIARRIAVLLESDSCHDQRTSTKKKIPPDDLTRIDQVDRDTISVDSSKAAKKSDSMICPSSALIHDPLHRFRATIYVTIRSELHCK